MMCLMSSNNSFGSSDPSGNDVDKTNHWNGSTSNTTNNCIFDTPPASNDRSSIDSGSSTLSLEDAKEDLQNYVSSDTYKAHNTPSKGWRRILVNSSSDSYTPDWKFHYVSPQGTRFHSYDEMVRFIDDHSSKSQKNKQLQNKPIKTKFLVKVSICDMKQNIFDMRRKRGRKQRKKIGGKKKFMNKVSPLKSTPIELSTNEHIFDDGDEDEEANRLLVSNIIDDLINTPTDLPTSTTISSSTQQPIRNLLPNPIASDEHLLKNKKVCDDITSAAINKLPMQNSCSNKILSHDNKMDKIKFLTVKKNSQKITNRNLNITLVDLFSKRLDSFVCSGCYKRYTDTMQITVNLSNNTIFMVCGNCSSWTKRKITTTNLPY